MLRYRLVCCPDCLWRTWFLPDEEDPPTHDCEQGHPHGMKVADFQQSTRVEPPWPKGRAR